jgi:hypothetical protein
MTENIIGPYCSCGQNDPSLCNAHGSAGNVAPIGGALFIPVDTFKEPETLEEKIQWLEFELGQHKGELAEIYESVRNLRRQIRKLEKDNVFLKKTK